MIQVDQPRLLENMRITLLEQNSTFSQLLVASLCLELKDHSYYASEGSLPTSTDSGDVHVAYGNGNPRTLHPISFSKDSLNMTAEERKD